MSAYTSRYEENQSFQEYQIQLKEIHMKHKVNFLYQKINQEKQKIRMENAKIGEEKWQLRYRTKVNV